MTRAGEVFATLTGGAFAGLDQSFNEDDEARLEARRVNGETAPVAHLSEGTCDQLYLALRLAYIEDYAARAEAPPFIGDDLFSSFDNSPNGQRSRSARCDRRSHSADPVHARAACPGRCAVPSRGCGRHHPHRLNPRRGGAEPVGRSGRVGQITDFISTWPDATAVRLEAKLVEFARIPQPFWPAHGTLSPNLSYAPSAPREGSGLCQNASERTDGRRM